MGTMPPDELLKLWKLEKLPPEMAIGHLLLSKTIETLDLKVFKLRADVDGLTREHGSPPHIR